MLQSPVIPCADPGMDATLAPAGLRYTTDATPGIVRQARGKGFVYLRPDGKQLRDKTILMRIKALVIPPAWTDVWIAPGADDYLQATGRDAKGRKQYRYHAGFTEIRDDAKFERLLSFALALPAIRRRVDRDMKAPGLSRERVLATVVSLLEETLCRVGNESYAQANNSFGMTTLRNRHVTIKGGELRFSFKGKGGKEWRLRVKNPRVAKVVRACHELPGQRLFEYRTGDGSVQPVDSGDVNTYLREASGQSVSAKDFRTWFGTVEAAVALEAFRAGGETPCKRHMNAAVKRAADRLGNTVTICRKSYIHPAVLADYGAGAFRLPEVRRKPRGMSADEARVLAYLRKAQRNTKRSARD